MNINKRIIRVLVVVSALFLALLSYLMYFNMFQAEQVATNPYNRRQWDDERYVTRGTVFDADGLVLAETVKCISEIGNRLSLKCLIKYFVRITREVKFLF